MFKTINSFGKLKGFDIILDFLEKEINFDILCFFIKGISGITPYLHRNFVKDLISRLKVVIEKHIFG